ncbi:MAG TPA: hypothetical protein DCO75_13240 [Fibrobacteres bacterium]|nr:hypothetical protein [Fibrobacterota bacterium]
MELKRIYDIDNVNCSLQNNKIEKDIPENYPVVSVIVPTQNRPAMLKRAITSILTQTYPDFEIIVINDGGGNIQEMINQLNVKNNIRYIHHEISKGRSAARNSGIKAAQGKYIAYLDDDDWYFPNHLSVLVNFMESNKVKAAYTDAYRAVEYLENNTYVIKQHQLLYSNDFAINKLLVQNLFPNLCVMHEKTCIDETGLFDETLETHEDWEMWLRISLKFQFHHIPVVTAEYSYRNDKTNTTTLYSTDFYATRKLIYMKYKNFAEMNPAVIDGQKNALKNHAGSVIADFMNIVTEYVEKGLVYKAISYYDKHRNIFDDVPDLEKFDSLVEMMKKKATTSCPAVDSDKKCGDGKMAELRSGAME